MDVQQLRCFLAVAEELHFGRAAERLHLTPSPVSRAVKELERELGAPLFIRSYHQVELTAVGQDLIDAANDIVAGVDNLKRRAAKAALGDGGKRRAVRIGGTFLCPPALLDRFVAVVEQALGDRAVEVTVAASADLIPDLETGELDAALVHVPLDRPNLDTFVVSRYTFMLAMRADDPLASAGRLSLADIAHRTVTIGPPTPQPAAMELFYSRLRKGGITSLHQMPEMDSVALAMHVRRSHGISLTLPPETGGSARIFDDPAFAIVPLEESENLEFMLGMAWQRDLVIKDEVVREIVHAVQRDWSDEEAPVVTGRRVASE